MWDLPRPGLEPVSPALSGGFVITAPPGKPLSGRDLIDFLDTGRIGFGTYLHIELDPATFPKLSKLTKFSVFPVCVSIWQQPSKWMFPVFLLPAQLGITKAEAWPARSLLGLWIAWPFPQDLEKPGDLLQTWKELLLQQTFHELDFPGQVGQRLGSHMSCMEAIKTVNSITKSIDI